MNITLPFGIHKTFYKTKASIQISGLLNGKSRELFFEEMTNNNFKTYFETLSKLLQEIIDTAIEGKIYLIIDNAPNHSPKLLLNRIKE